MKKIYMSITLIIIFLISSNSLVYADSNENWVGDSFSAAYSFLNEPTKDFHGILSLIFSFFQGAVKGFSRVLLVLLAGISTIALAITGVRYIASGASPGQREVAKKSLHTIFIGMAIGFGAYIIWKIAMAVVTIMIQSFA